MHKKIGIVVLVILVAAVGVTAHIYDNLEKFVRPGAVPPASYWVDEDKALRAQTVRVEIAGRVFQIPQMYIDSKMPLSGVIKDSVLLEVIWPEMRSIYELKDKREYDRIWKEEGRRGWILIHTSDAKPSLRTQVANIRRNMIVKEEYLGKVNGLDKYLWFLGSPEGPKLWAELYLEVGKNGEILSYNQCNVGDGIVFQGCSQRFVDDGLYFQISYRKEAFFSEWREQHDRAINLLSGMEVNSDN